MRNEDLNKENNDNKSANLPQRPEPPQRPHQPMAEMPKEMQEEVGGKNGGRISAKPESIGKILFSIICAITLIAGIGVGGYFLYTNLANKPESVHLVVNGGDLGDELQSFTFEPNKPLSNLPTPAREGYAFVGWFTKEDGGEKIEEGDTLSADTNKLYAQWEVCEYDVTFDCDGGNVEQSTLKVTYGTTYGELKTPVKTGYEFDGWYYIEPNTQTKTKITSSSYVNVARNHTLVAMWRAESYDITLSYENGASDSVKTVIYNDFYDFGDAPTREGYIFAGWWTKPSDGTLPCEIKNGDKVEGAVPQQLYARWEGQRHTITLNINGGQGDSAQFEIVNGEICGDKLPTPTYEGYTFVGWRLSNGEIITPTSIITLSGNDTLTAQWEANEYELTLEKNNGEENDTQNVIFEQAYGTLPTPTREGCTFAGWYLNSGCTGDAITAETIVTTAGNHTLFAKWEANSYTVTFDPNEGSVTPTTALVTYNAAYGTLPTPTRDGYTFIGWYYNSGFTGEIVMPHSINTTIGNHTLYAKWGTAVYTIALDFGNGSTNGTLSVEYDSNYAFGANPTRTGYTFAGWWTSLGGEGVQITTSDIVPATPPTMLYAKWTLNTATIKLGTLDNLTKIEYSTDQTIWTELTEAGFTANANTNYYFKATPATAATGYTITFTSFTGWFEDETATSNAYSFTNNGQTYTVGGAATQTANTYTITLQYNNGEEDGSKTMTYGQTYNLGANPTYPGYTFIGWYLNDDYTGEKITSDTFVSTASNHTLYAKWGTSVYEITLAYGNGQPNGTLIAEYDSNYAFGANPTRTGYTFAGWWTSLGGDGVQITTSDIVPATPPTMLYAKWALNTSVIKLGTLTNITKIEYSTDQTTWTELTAAGFTANANTDYYFRATPVAATTGYTISFNGFTGWFEDETATSNAHSFIENAQIYIVGGDATQTANTYTVTLNPNEGFIGTTQITVTFGSTYDALPTPSRAGYTFVGWLTETAQPITSTSEVVTAANHSLIANWQVNVYDVTLVYNNGNENGSISATFGSNYSLGANPTRVGYTFAGWHLREDLTDAVVTNETIVTSLANHSLFAAWTARNYTVTLNPTNGYVTPETATVAYDSAYGILPTPFREGYTFDGWYLNSGCTGDAITAETIVTTANNHSIYAKWTLNTSTFIRGTLNNITKIEYSTDQTTWTELTEAGFTANANTDYYFRATPATETGYTITFTGFTGWLTDTTATSSAHSFTTSGQTYTIGGAATKTLNTSLIVLGTLTNVTRIEYSTDQTTWAELTATGFTANANMNYYFKAIPATAATGYTIAFNNFTGWFEDVTANSDAHLFTDAGQTYAIGAIAQEIANNYIITFNANDGVVTPTTTTAAYDSAYGTLPTPTKAGHTFMGWYLNSDCTGEAITASTIVTTANNHSIYAKWQANDAFLLKSWKTIVPSGYTKIFFTSTAPDASDTLYHIGATDNTGDTAIAQPVTADFADVVGYIRSGSLYIYSDTPVILPVDSSNLFYELSAVTQIDLAHASTAQTTHMTNMFGKCTSLAMLNLTTLNTSNVVDMLNMFYNCSMLTTLDLTNFDTSLVVDMSYMFRGCGRIETLDLSNFNTSNLTSVANMFDGCSSLTSLNLSSFDFSNVADLSVFFWDSLTLTEIYTPYNNVVDIDLGYLYLDQETGEVYDKIASGSQQSLHLRHAQPISLPSNWKTTINTLINPANITEIEFIQRDTNTLLLGNKKTRISHAANGDITAYLVRDAIAGTDTKVVFYSPKVITRTYDCTFRDLTKLTKITFTNFYSRETSLAHMFRDCSSLTTLDLSNFNTKNTTDMSYMFSGCSALTSLNLSSFDTANVINMSGMFSGCNAVLDLSNFDTSNVTNMSLMFNNSTYLTRLDLSSFDTSNVTNMNGMFSGCDALTSLNLSGFNLSRITNSNNLPTFNNLTALSEIYTPYNNAYQFSKFDYCDFTDCDTGLVYTNIPANLTTSLHLMRSPGALLQNWQTLITSLIDPWDITEIEFAPMSTNVATLGNNCVTINDIANGNITAYLVQDSTSKTNTKVVFYSPNQIYAPKDSTYLFMGLGALTRITFANFDTTDVVNMYGMFANSYALEALDLSGFNTSSVTNMFGMLNGCGAASLNISSFDLTNVTQATNRLYVNDLSSLTEIYTPYNNSYAISLPYGDFKLDGAGATYTSIPAGQTTSMHLVKVSE